MQPTTPAAANDSTETARALSRALELDPAALAGAVLEMLDRVEALVSVKDVASGRYLYANSRMSELFGRTPAEMVGVTDADLMEQPQAHALRAAEQTALAAAAPTSTDLRFERNGRKREFSATRLGFRRADSEPSRHVLGVWVEQTAAHQRELQLQRALEQLEQQQLAAEALRREAGDTAQRDERDGIYQGSRFDEQVRREVDLSSREHREFALVAIALDPFSAQTQALGDAAHERVVDALARLLRSRTRAMDASCRVDRDRFAVLLSGVGLATAHSRMEGLRRQCATQIVVLEGRDLGFTVSMGVASFPNTAHNEDDLLAAAETALLEAQRRGGNHVALASIQFDTGASS